MRGGVATPEDLEALEFLDCEATVDSMVAGCLNTHITTAGVAPTFLAPEESYFSYLIPKQRKHGKGGTQTYRLGTGVPKNPQHAGEEGVVLLKHLFRLLGQSEKRDELLLEMYKKSKHDPRAAVVGLIEILRGKPLTPEFTEFLEHVDPYKLCQVLAPGLYAGENREFPSILGRGFASNLASLDVNFLDSSRSAKMSMVYPDSLTPEQRIEKVIKELGVELTPEQREHFESLSDVDAGLYLIQLAREKEPTSATKELLFPRKPLNEVEHTIQGWKKNLPKEE